MQRNRFSKTQNGSINVANMVGKKLRSISWTSGPPFGGTSPAKELAGGTAYSQGSMLPCSGRRKEKEEAKKKEKGEGGGEEGKSGEIGGRRTREEAYR